MISSYSDDEMGGIWRITRVLCLTTGMPTEDNEQIQAAAQKLRDQGVELVIAKLGTKGSLLIQKDQVVQQGIVKADKVSHVMTHM